MSNSAQLRYTNRKGFRLWMHQFFAVLLKRMLLTIRAPSSIIVQVLIPLAYIIILVLVTNVVQQIFPEKKNPIHIYNRYSTNVLFFQEKTQSEEAKLAFETLIQRGLGPWCPNGFAGFQCDKPNSNQVPTDTQDIKLGIDRSACTDCMTYCLEGNARKVRNWKTPNSDLVYQLPPSMNAMDWVLVVNQSDHWVMGGFQYYSFNYNFSSSSDLGQELGNTTPPAYMVVWTRPESKMAMLNAFNNLILQTYSKDKSSVIEVYSEDIRFPKQADDNKNTRNILDIVSIRILDSNHGLPQADAYGPISRF